MQEDLKAAAIFLLGTLLWIEYTDYLVMEYFVDGESFAYYSHFKGIIYSFLATAFVYVTVRKRTRSLRSLTETLEHELEEKAFLNMEVHHRVKNNLALISAMIELQMMHLTDSRLLNQLERMKLRIYAIAQIEEQIYQRESLSGVLINDFLTEYLDHISTALNHKTTFTNRCSDEVLMSLNQAIPLGIIFNELINLIGEFDPPASPGCIRVTSEEYEDGMRLIIYSETDTDLALVFASDSVQALIIKLYVDQLDINMDLRRDDDGCQMVLFNIPLKENIRGAHSNYRSA